MNYSKERTTVYMKQRKITHLKYVYNLYNSIARKSNYPVKTSVE